MTSHCHEVTTVETLHNFQNLQTARSKHKTGGFFVKSKLPYQLEELFLSHLLARLALTDHATYISVSRPGAQGPQAVHKNLLVQYFSI